MRKGRSLDCSIRKVDPEIYRAIQRELRRQRETINLIASENYAPPEVMEAQGSILTNKYAEGYPQHRYYGGCEFVDEIEEIARERAKMLFGAEHANVQPHSGTQANMAVYFALMKPGDVLLGQGLKHGGHLSHGSRVNFSGEMFHSFEYCVDRETELINYDEVLELAKRCRPRVIVAGSSAYSREIDFKAFRRIADEVGAYLLADVAHIAGLIVAGLHQSPVGSAQFITSTTHKTLCGPRGGLILCDGAFADLIDRSVFPGIQGGPLVHVIAAKAIAFKNAMTPEFRSYQELIVKNSKALCAALMKRGFRVVSGGTDNHMFLVDLRNRGITGAEAEDVLRSVGIVVNKNSIPYDDKPASITSGIRLGTPAVSRRGMGPAEMEVIAGIIEDVIKNRSSEQHMRKNRQAVLELASAFPVYPEL